MRVLIASTNFGKIQIYKQILDELGIESTSLKELNVTINVEENGKTELDNAIIKAKSYYNATKMPVLANDSGLIIDKFTPENQPGVLVRRYKGVELSDEDMINLYVNKLNEVGGFSTGHYNVALAIINENGELFTREFKPKRFFINKPSKIIVKGVPLSSLAFDEKTQRYMSEMTTKERNEYESEEMLKQKQFIAEIFSRGA